MDEIDTLKPWTIRDMPTRVSKAIAQEAHQREITTARLVETVWRDWTQGSPRSNIPDHDLTALPPPQPPPDDDLIALLHAAAALAAHTNLPPGVRARIDRLARASKSGSSATLGIGHDAT